MKKDGRLAAREMEQAHKANSTVPAGFCLKTCRIAWGLAPDEPSAIKEWNSINPKNKRKNPNNAPVGAPHFWEGGKFGHVALQSRFKGYVWTTDVPKGKIGLVHLSLIEEMWGYKYLGWSAELQNKVLPLNTETV